MNELRGLENSPGPDIDSRLAGDRPLVEAFTRYAFDPHEVLVYDMPRYETVAHQRAIAVLAAFDGLTGR